MSLAEETDARKARLLALRKRKLGQDDGDNGQSAEAFLSGRNFDNQTRTLRKHVPVEQTEDTLEKNATALLEQVIVEDENRRVQELDLFNIAPKRPDWDLKRQMEKKMAKLERKTQEAIHTLIRQRLSAQKGQSYNIADAIKAEGETRDDSGSDSDGN